MLKSLKTAVLFLTFAMFGDQNTGKYRRILLHNRTMGLSKDISCHKAYVKNDLPAADERSFPEKSIFFLETSCKGGLDSRQACSVESAARANSLWQVNVLFAGPVHGKLRKSLSILHQYKNIKFFRIHPRELAKGTPLDSFLAADPLKTSDWPICHASDILRYIVLYKWGGVYLDLDMIVLRPFDGLGKNWAGQEMGIAGKAEVGSSALAFSRDQLGRKVAAAAVEYVFKYINKIIIGNYYYSKQTKQLAVCQRKNFQNRINISRDIIYIPSTNIKTQKKNFLFIIFV